MTRKTWLWLAATATAAALVATFLLPFGPRLVPFEEAGAPPTPVGWSAPPLLLAGDGIRGATDGAGPSARFDDPWGVAIADDGTVFVADAGDNNRIRRIAPDGRVTTFAGSSEGFLDGPAGSARFDSPSAIAIDLAGNLYVADTGNHAIRRIAADGTVSTLAGNGRPGFRDGVGAEAMFDGPVGVAVDVSGRVLVADTYNDRIRVIDPGGRVTTLAGDGEPGLQDGPGARSRFDSPTGVAVDARGRAWVADPGNGAIRVVRPDGLVATLRSGAPTIPLAIARSHDGVLYVAGAWPSRVYQVGRDGHWSSVTVLPRDRRLSVPAGIAVGLDGRVVVADAGAFRIHRFDAPVETRVPLAGRHAGDDDKGVEAAADPGHDPVAASWPAPGPVGPDPAAPLPDTGGRWPLAPQDGWHEVVGTLGEVRGNYGGESRDHLHAGLDIRGDVGQRVLAIAAAKVALPLPAWNAGGLSEGFALDALDYIHMRVGRTAAGDNLDPDRFRLLEDADGNVARVRIRRGTRFEAGDALGTINRMAHVHLQAGSSGYQRNALALGFGGFVDTVAPHIDAIEILDADDRPLPRRDGRVDVPADARDLRLVVEAWDQVDGNLPRRRLGLYAVGFEWLHADGRPVAGMPAAADPIEFDRMPPGDEAVRAAYAPGSGITVHGSRITRFRYELTNRVRGGEVGWGRWQASDLAPGDYLLRVRARDWSGNEATAGRDLPVRIR